jgi:hypothetical protein
VLAVPCRFFRRGRSLVKVFSWQPFLGGLCLTGLTFFLDTKAAVADLHRQTCA